MYILAYNTDLTFNGFFIEGVSNNIPEQNIKIDDELFEYLSNLKFKLDSDLDLNKDLYTILDKDLFKIEDLDVVAPDRLDLINANLLQELLQKDIEIKDLNMNLAQTTLDLVNKDIEIKNLQKDVSNLILQTLGGN